MGILSIIKAKLCSNEKEVKEYTHCLRCGRKLKNPEAKKIGFGKVCLEKQQWEDKQRLFEVNKNGNK